jgi:hypothetical protein
MTLSQQTGWTLEKFVFVVVVGIAYVCACFAAIYPIYMYLH